MAKNSKNTPTKPYILQIKFGVSTKNKKKAILLR
jgi:hypothetical protein